MKIEMRKKQSPMLSLLSLGIFGLPFAKQKNLEPSQTIAPGLDGLLASLGKLQSGGTFQSFRSWTESLFPVFMGERGSDMRKETKRKFGAFIPACNVMHSIEDAHLGWLTVVKNNECQLPSASCTQYFTYIISLWVAFFILFCFGFQDSFSV